MNISKMIDYIKTNDDFAFENNNTEQENVPTFQGENKGEFTLEGREHSEWGPLRCGW